MLILITENFTTLLTPTKSVIKAGTSRDELPNGNTLHRLENEYTFKLPAKVKVSMALPFSQAFYDTVFSIMAKVYDSRGQLVKSSATSGTEFELAQGDYVVRSSVWHADYNVLSRHKTAPLELSRPMPDGGDESEAVSLGVFKGKSMRLCHQFLHR
jgi:hypothetical protein